MRFTDGDYHALLYKSTYACRILKWNTSVPLVKLFNRARSKNIKHIVQHAPLEATYKIDLLFGSNATN